MTTVAVVDGAVWVASDGLARFSGGAWERLDPPCALGSFDALADDDAWAAELVGPGRSRLCHFDGSAWTEEETASEIDILIAGDDGLYALTTETGLVSFRPTGSSGWVVVDALRGSEMTPFEGGVLVRELTEESDAPLHAVRADAIERLPDTPGGAVAIAGGERGQLWASVNRTERNSDTCVIDLTGGATDCTNWTQEVLFHLEDTAYSEVAHINHLGFDVGTLKVPTRDGRLLVISLDFLHVTD